jgi:hypothetical protein
VGLLRKEHFGTEGWFQEEIVGVVRIAAGDWIAAGHAAIAAQRRMLNAIAAIVTCA